LNGEECVLSDCSYTAGINDYYFGGGDGQHGVVNSKGDYKLAIPFILYASAKYAGRGESIFDERESLFASLDGDLSMWQESVDAGAPKTGVSKSLLKHDPNTGNPIIPDGLTRYFLLEEVRSGDGNGGKLGIEQIQFDIPWQSYYETHASFLDSILMGFMSPATLGIDVGKVDSGESVREKQTMTMHTRSYIVEAMSEVVKELAKTAVQSYYDYWKLNQMATEPSVDFGDYASPTSDAKADTITKCKQGGFMSIRTAVKEYHGDSKSDEWIDEEVARIKEDMNIGFADIEEPSFGGDVDYPSVDDEDEEDDVKIMEEPEEDDEEE
jgi:hypothetical protein